VKKQPPKAHEQWAQDLVARLPKDLNVPESFVLGKKNFTIEDAPWQTGETYAAAAVWLSQNSFYISNVTGLPEFAQNAEWTHKKDGDGIGARMKIKVNGQQCVQLNFGATTAQMKTSWLMVQSIIAHQTITDAPLLEAERSIDVD
jgi:hypothetical protein